MRKQFVTTLERLAAKDEKLVVVLGDIGVFGLRRFQEKWPDRFYNIGICEQSMIGIGAGLASQGFYPVLHTILPFMIERAYEQIKIDLCYQKLGVNLASVGAAFDYMAEGPTHHGYQDFALLRGLPGMQVLCPGTPAEFDTLFEQTYRNGSPTYIRMSSGQHNETIAPDRIRFGQGLILKEGWQATVVVTGPQLKNVLEATAGLDVEVLYIHTIEPLDIPLIRTSAQKTKQILTVEEHTLRGGLGAAVSEAVEDMPGVTVSRIGIPHQFLSQYGTHAETCRVLGLDAAGINARVQALLRGKAAGDVSPVLAGELS